MNIINEHELEDNHPLSFLYAYKGGKGGGYTQSAAEIAADKAQTEELATLEAQEASRTEAMARKKRGRASLISGDETGNTQLKKTLGGN